MLNMTIVIAVRIVLVPFICAVSFLIAMLVKLGYFVWTGGRTKLVFLWIPLWRRRQFREVFEASQEAMDEGNQAAELLPEVFANDSRSWWAVIRRSRYRRPEAGEAICPPTNNPNFWLQFVLRQRGSSWMVFDQDYFPKGSRAVVKIVDREERGDRGIVSIGELSGVRCELRETADNGKMKPTVDVGESVLVEVTESRGRTCVASLAERSWSSLLEKVTSQTSRRKFMVVASPWVYMELGIVDAFGTQVLRVEEIRLPSRSHMPRSQQTLHRLVVRNGRPLQAKDFMLIGLDAPAAPTCGPVPSSFPVYPEWQRPKEFAVFVAFASLFATLNVLWSNRRTHRNLFKQLRQQETVVTGDSLIRFATLENFDNDNPQDFWAFTHSDAKLQHKGASTGSVTHLQASAKSFTNKNGEEYRWVSSWSKKEPTCFQNVATAWWRKRTEPKRYIQVWNRIAASLMGHVTLEQLDNHTSQLEDYLAVLESISRETADEEKLFGVAVEDAGRDGTVIVRFVGKRDWDKGDSVVLYDSNQASVAGAVVACSSGKKLWLNLVRGNVGYAKHIMMTSEDIPTRVQRESLTQVRADSSLNNYVSGNLRSCGGWFGGLLRLGRRNISLYNKRIESNASAVAALERSLRESSRVAMVQGPPGTGKTTFIVELIHQLVLNQHKKVLLVSQGNLAVDEALERVSAATDRILAVRIGDYNKISDSVKHLHYDSRDMDAKARLRERLTAKGISIILRPWDVGGLLSLAKNEMMAREAAAAEQKEWENLASHVDLVCATCVGIGTGRAMPFGDLTYDVVIIDEASRATQTEAMIPLRLGRRWVLVGDHKQLPPTMFPEVKDRLLAAGVSPLHGSISLFELLQGVEIKDSNFKNLFKVNSRDRAILTTQYRMHPAIARFVSAVFYDDPELIKSDGDALHRGLPFAPFESPICVVDTRDWPRQGRHKLCEWPLNQEQRGDRPETSRSLSNPLEVSLVVEVIKKLAAASKQADGETLGRLQSNGGEHAQKISFAIITPYREQVFQIRAAIGQIRDWGLLHIESDSVATIDSYQGKERDIVIFSCVRTARSAKTNLQFLEDLRRLNVAFSRARHKLILIGDGATLQNADRDIMQEHGKKVFERFLNATFNDGDIQHVWSTPDKMTEEAVEK